MSTIIVMWLQVMENRDDRCFTIVECQSEVLLALTSGCIVYDCVKHLTHIWESENAITYFRKWATSENLIFPTEDTQMWVKDTKKLRKCRRQPRVLNM